MSDKPDYGEPWRRETVSAHSRDAEYILERIDPDLLDRIIACVNACAGVPTEVLPELADLLQRFVLWTKPIATIPTKEATRDDNIGSVEHDNFRWFPDEEDL